MFINEQKIRSIIRKKLLEFQSAEMNSADIAARASLSGLGSDSSKNEITVDSEKIVDDIAELSGIKSGLDWGKDSKNAKVKTNRKNAWAYLYPFFESDVQLEECGFVKIDNKLSEQHYFTISGMNSEEFKTLMGVLSTTKLTEVIEFSSLGAERPKTTVKEDKLYFRFTDVAEYNKKFFDDYLKDEDED